MKEEIRQSHEERCKEQGHVWENCMSIIFQIYQQCKYCKEIR